MTRPSILAFLHDHSPPDQPRTKIYLRTLIYSTSKRGHVIESMHATLRRNESRQTFNMWAFGDKSLAVGGGLFVPDGGVVGNHHFMTPPSEETYSFRPGAYSLKVFANVVGQKSSTLLFAHSIEITLEESEALKDPLKSVMFIWGPDSQKYLSSIEAMPVNMRGLQDLLDKSRTMFGRT